MNRSIPHLASMARAAALGACLCTAAVLSGCVAYPYYPPGTYAPSTFDRAYDAALGALSDQGLSITSQDRASGNIVGARGAFSVAATVRPQADGTTQVAFTPRGQASAQDAGVVERVVGAYNARMGR
jgi:hypothetical protein